MKKFDVSIEDENVVLRSSAGEVESIRINGGASFNLVRDNKLVLKIESPVVGANGMPLDHEGSVSQREKETEAECDVDMQVIIAAWIIANDGCENIHCNGVGGMFNSIPCPLSVGVNDEPCEHTSRRKIVSVAKALLDKYHRRKANATEKQEPRKICGTCRHVSSSVIDLDMQQIVLCGKNGRKVPVLHEGCLDFEPKIREESALERLSAVVKSGAEAAEASSKIVAEYLSGVAFSTRLAGDKDTMERIAQLEKEKAELQDQNAQLREKLAAAIEDVKSKDGFLVEQSVQAMRRIDDLEREASKRNWPPRIRFYL